MIGFDGRREDVKTVFHVENDQDVGPRTVLLRPIHILLPEPLVGLAR